MNTSKKDNKYIVGIGASAGGLEAIHEFFDHMPASSNFAFVIVQHLSSDYKSLLVELVSKHTHMKVFEAEHEMPVHPDCVYIIPNNKLMTVEKGKLKLSVRSDSKSPNTAIDTFFRSLGKDQKEQAIAIILSGTGTDGTKGIDVVKSCGGMVIVQEPLSAKFDGMPNHAIGSGNADHILQPHEMPAQLFKFVGEEPANVIITGKINDEDLDQIFKLVYRENGHDFNLYKTPTIIRRITRRMNELKVTGLKEYIDVLNENTAEVKTLGKDFLIGVTQFFRDKAAFEILESTIIPEIISTKDDGSAIKVWVCACSTGEEAYSIAILLNKCVEKSGKKIDIKVFATDVDETSLDIASKNHFPLRIEKDVPRHVIEKYFVRENHHYSVIPIIRKQIVFAKHDVIKSPPFIKNDLVTCRNMLIYVNNVLQQKILGTFHFSLAPDGYLFLGSSENGNALKEGFKEINGKWKVYQKRGTVKYSFNSGQANEMRTVKAANFKRTDGDLASDLENDFNSFLVSELGFAGVYIDSGYVIRQVVGNYKKFLSLPDGQIELNILKMVPRSIAALLNTAIRRSLKENETIRLNALTFNDHDPLINIAVRKPQANGSSDYILLAFSEVPADVAKRENKKTIPESVRTDEVILELEAELNETRTNLQMAVEEMETTNEELQSSNEELLSANEELQSGNEELQSLNEELHTLNTEHQLKIRELIDLNDDLHNYFTGINIGLIFLSSALQIRKFNPAAVEMVNLIDADIGRSFEHISNNVVDENLLTDIHLVLAKGKTIEKEITVTGGVRCLMRVMPYLRRDKTQDGVILSFVDITHLTELSNLVNGVFNASTSCIFAFSAVRNRSHKIIDFKCTSFNNAATELVGQKELITHASLVNDLPELVPGTLFSRYVDVVETGNAYRSELFLLNKWYEANCVKMGDGLVISFVDTTATKNIEQKLRKNYNELIEARENLRNLNADLEDRIEDRTRELTASEERFKLVSSATNDTIWDWDLASNTLWRNENFSLMFGYSLNNESQNTAFWFDRIHPDDRETVKKSVFDTINKKKEQLSARYRFLKADGTYAFVLDRGRVLKDEYKTPFRVVGSTIDITQLIETEKKLTLSQSKFRKIFESNVIGMTFASLRTGQIFEANQAFQKMIGYPVDELTDPQRNWVHLTPPEFFDVTKKAIDEVRTNGFCQPFEKQYIRKNGERFWVLAASSILDENEGDELVTYVIDISVQKENERRKNDLQKLIIKQKDQFYSIFKYAPALITIRTGQELRYQFVNEAFRQFDGQDHYVGKTAKEAGSEFSYHEIDKISAEVLSSGIPYSSNSVKITKAGKDGVEKTFWYDFTVTPVYLDEGTIEGVAFFGFDVSDLVLGKQAVQELMHRKDEFLSIASHELKTPITSIKLSLQVASRLLRSGKSVQNLEQFIDKANRQGDKLNELVQDLLDVTKIQAGKMVFNYSTFDSQSLIQQCVDDVQDHNDSHEIRIISNENVSLHADMNRIEQVIINFISNAVKYSPEANLVEISSIISKDKFRLSVRDFGIGIPKDKQDQIFDRFYRVQESSVKFSGLGLGLYISAEIIRRHNGTIGVSSEDGKGSEFWFEIPLTVESA